MLEPIDVRAVERQWMSAPIVRVAMYVDGRTWIEPLPCVYTQLGLVVGATRAQRARFARAAGRVCVQTDDAVDPNDWSSVMAWARPRFLADEAAGTALAALRDRVGWSASLRAALARDDGRRTVEPVLLRLEDESGRRQRGRMRRTYRKENGS